MAAFKIIFQFFGESGEQFSDVFYREASTLDEATNLKGQNYNLITDRLNLLDNQNVFRSYRVSQVSSPRVAQTIAVNQNGLTGAGTGPGTGPATAGQAMIWSLNGTTSGSRKWWIRGFSSGDLETDSTTGLPSPSDKFRGSVRKFLTDAAASGFGVLKLTTVPRDPNNFVPVVTLVKGMVDGQTVVTPAASTQVWTQGNKIIFQGFSKKDFPGLNGVFQILSPTGSPITIKYRLPPYTTVPTPTGTIRQQNFVSPIAPFAPDKCAFFNGGTHRTKDPFGGSRGRRSATRLRGLP